MSKYARQLYGPRLKRWLGLLDAAYRASSYCTADLVITIGKRHPLLDEALRAKGCRTWAFLTAANPRSRCLSDADNRQRLHALQERLKPIFVQIFSGESLAARAGRPWPAEPGFLVQGISVAEASALARSFGQHALVYGQLGGEAKLLWLTPWHKSPFL